MKEANKLHQLASNIAKGISRREMKRWPPDCFGLTYQPARPQNLRNEKNSTNKHCEKECNNY